MIDVEKGEGRTGKHEVKMAKRSVAGPVTRRRAGKALRNWRVREQRERERERER